MIKTSNTLANSLHFEHSEDTKIISFLQCVQYLNPLTEKAIIKLSQRFFISPEQLALLIDISLKEGALLWN